MPNNTTQIKFTIESKIVSGFKAKCASKGVSMAEAVRQWMVGYQPAGSMNLKTLSRPDRRKAVGEIIGLLTEVLDMEEQYRDLIPEQFVQRIEAAEQACAQLGEAIGLLEDAF